MNQIKIGLLPLYIKLYDDSAPELRVKVESFLHTLEDEFRKRNVIVESSKICRIHDEFKDAVKSFEKADVDAIVTIHLAYSPSLESSDVLAKTELPIIILDTTLNFEFDAEQDTDRINYNHGIHGVQDMCNLLIRNHKSFQIEAGHWSHSDVIDRVTGWVKAAHLASVLKNIRVGRIGEPFKGMGDFYLSKQKMESTIGIKTVEADTKELASFLEQVTPEEIEDEIASDKKKFAILAENELYKVSIKAGISLRKWVKKNKLSAFTFNFLAINKASGLPVVPFLEAGKAMAAGFGYAGEGDVLTAALVGTLLSVYPDTAFVEMFCPDWRNNSIFISHMGEMNVNLSADIPRLIDILFSYTDADRPCIAAGRYRAGKASLVNLAPGSDDKYTLIVVPVEMLDVNGQDNMQDTVRGWFKPLMELQEFLPAYSRLGGTHHSALVYGDVKADIMRFGEIMGWDVKTI
jgi:L-arabinose isomerase